MADTTTTIARGFPAPPPELPDKIRARVRTAAQTAWGVLWAMLARWVAQRYGVKLGDIPDELEAVLTGAAVGLAAAAWMFVVSRITRVLPWFERVFLMTGAPLYVQPPAVPPRAGNG